MKPLFINGLACISPQATFLSSEYPFEAKEYLHSRLFCVEPDYSPYIDPKAARRLGRLLKFGTTAGLQALSDAAVACPDAICTGTGFGLLDDSGKFLKNFIEAEEGVVSPTAFIQSTHNTVSANIALAVSCRGHNNTFVHKGFSFESALLDAQMLLAEGTRFKNILAGAYDETTEYSFAIMKRLGLIRNDASNFDLLAKKERGTLAGEGAAFFLLSVEKGENCYGLLHGCEMVFHPASVNYLEERLFAFLADKDLKLEDVDIVISGLCGDPVRDEMLHALNKSVFTRQTIIAYKHLCGEYMTSSAFACWLAAMAASKGNWPQQCLLADTGRKAENILICNAYKQDYSFILITRA